MRKLAILILLLLSPSLALAVTSQYFTRSGADLRLKAKNGKTRVWHSVELAENQSNADHAQHSNLAEVYPQQGFALVTTGHYEGISGELVSLATTKSQLVWGKLVWSSAPPGLLCVLNEEPSDESEPDVAEILQCDSEREVPCKSLKKFEGYGGDSATWKNKGHVTLSIAKTASPEHNKKETPFTYDYFSVTCDCDPSKCRCDEPKYISTKSR